jgi:hypothetical protein
VASPIGPSACGYAPLMLVLCANLSWSKEMITSYKLVEDAEKYEVYQFNPGTRYWLYLSILPMLAYDLVEYKFFPLLGVVSFLLYLFLCFIPSRKNLSSIKAAMKQGTVELSGSPWSFSNPQRVRIPKPLGSGT